MTAAVGWPFRIERYYEREGDRCVFYPSTYSAGYRVDAGEEARLNRELEPFLHGRLKIEFLAVSFGLMSVVCAAMLMVPVDLLITTPRWALVAGSFAIAAVLVFWLVFRVRRKIAGLLADMEMEANEPPRPDFFMVDGAFSLARLSYVVFFFGVVLTGIDAATPEVSVPEGAYAAILVGAMLLFLFDRIARAR